MLKLWVGRGYKALIWSALGMLGFYSLIRFVGLPLLADYLDVPDANLAAIATKSFGTNQNQSRFVKIENVSEWMRLAILAAEDHRYYTHHGIDSLGLIRAGIDNFRAGHMVEGASTISQQLAKIAFLNQDERTARRKFSQLILAVQLEDKYSKEQILEAYLNTIYYGRGAYGIENAAKRYFGIPASKLSIAQSAFLAGLVKAPSVLGSKGNLKDAIARQQVVIDNMREYDYISEIEAKESRREKLKCIQNNP